MEMMRGRNIIKGSFGLVAVAIGLINMTAGATTTTAPITTKAFDPLEGAPEDYKAECHKDKTKLWSVEDNYLDCKKDKKMVAANKLDCCLKAGVVGCCDPNNKFPGDANWIWAGITLASITLIVGCFLYNWCDKDTFPWLERYQDRIDKQKGNFVYCMKCGCILSKADKKPPTPTHQPRAEVTENSGPFVNDFGQPGMMY